MPSPIRQIGYAYLPARHLARSIAAWFHQTFGVTDDLMRMELKAGCVKIFIGSLVGLALCAPPQPE